MADSFPIPVRTGVAREPLDPTLVTPGPQPVDVSDREGPNVIVGEVLKPGRHRAARPRRKIAISGAVLSAAGAFVTLALMMNHSGGSTVSAAPRISPSSPLPDLPDEPTAAQHPLHTAPAAPPTHAAPPAAHPVSTLHTAVPVVDRAPAQTPQQRFAAEAAHWQAQVRRDAARNAQTWAAAMRQAQRGQSGQQYSAATMYESQSAQQSAQSPAHPDRAHGGGHARHGRGGGGHRGHH